MNSANNDNKNTKKKVAVGAGIVAIIILILLLLRSCGGGPTDPIQDDPNTLNPGGGTVTSEALDTMTQEEIQAMLNEQAEKGYITISMNPTPEFETGTSKGNLLISNVHGYALTMDGQEMDSKDGDTETELEFTFDGHDYKVKGMDFRYIDVDEPLTVTSTDGAATITFSKTEREEDGKTVTDYTYTCGDKTGTYVYTYENGNWYDQVVEIYLVNDDGSTGDLIYTSPVIPVGSYVHEDQLDVDLDKGEYKAIACFYNVEENDDGELTIMGQGNAEITITVKN